MTLPQDVLDGCFQLTADEGLAGRAGGYDSADGDIRQREGLLRHRLGDFLGARSLLESAAHVGSIQPVSRCALAECYARTGCVETASRLYRELADDADCPTEVLPDVASGLGGLGEYEAALAACREIIRRDPGHHQARFGVAFYLRRLGSPPDAVLPDASRAFELAPEVPLYRIALAVLFDMVGCREDAYDLLRDVDACAVPCRYCLQTATAISARRAIAHASERSRPRPRRCGKDHLATPERLLRWPHWRRRLSRPRLDEPT